MMPDSRFAHSLSMTALSARNLTLADYASLQKRVQDSGTPMLWLFVGDSITHGEEHTHGHRNYVELWQEVIKWEHGLPPHRGLRRRDIIINSGAAGDSLMDFRKQMAWHLGQFCADVVFINFGINDAGLRHDEEQFGIDLKRIIEAAREREAIPVLQVPTLTRDGLTTRTTFANIVRSVADAERVLLVDHAAYWQELSGSDEAKPEWMSDEIHPNEEGHRMMVKVLATELNLVPPYSSTIC